MNVAKCSNLVILDVGHFMFNLLLFLPSSKITTFEHWYAIISVTIEAI